MSELKGKLGELLGTKGLMSGAEWRRKLETLEEQRASGEYEIDTVVNGEVVGEDEDVFYRVRQDFPLDTRHGALTLGAALEAPGELIALSACDDDLETFDAARAVFIDTETTGLSGGTGTVAFLVGVGYFTDNAFRLEQCFMRDYDEEEPLLTYLDGLFRDKDALVSYNGKSFDVPLLRTRFIQNRIPFRLDAGLHFDLVHAARRFLKRRLGGCSLGNVEKAVLGIQRHGDVPSSEIPQMYFDYLRTRDARPLKGVFYHHQMDILSLVTLTAWLAHGLDGERGGFEHREDRISLVRVHYLRKEYDEVVEKGTRLLEEDLEATVRHEVLEYLGFAFKRIGAWPRMEETWSLLLEESPKHLLARLELAKHHEHRSRNLLKAEELCAEAVQALEIRAALGRSEGTESPQLDMFTHRLERIRRKLGRESVGDGGEA
ncbi:MAG: hypothetical protein GY851_05500 [bacterium]|nr:hypothetical protein [bacterium]